MSYQVLVHMKVGHADQGVVDDAPKMQNCWVDCEYLETIIADGDNTDEFHVRIYVPELDYTCVTENWYLRKVENG